MQNSTQVLIHSPANFPYVRERGFLVGLGQEVNVQVDATGKNRYLCPLYLKFCIFNVNSNHCSDEIVIFIIPSFNEIFKIELEKSFGLHNLVKFQFILCYDFHT